MPRLVLFAASERAICDDNGSSFSLISLLDVLTVEQLKNAGPSAFDIAPMKWAVVAMWRRELDDKESEYFEQIVRLIAPDGTDMFEQNPITQRFLFTKLGHRARLRMSGFPIRGAGEYEITLGWRRAGEPDEAWRTVARYPIVVEFKAME